MQLLTGVVLVCSLVFAMAEYAGADASTDISCRDAATGCPQQKTACECDDTPLTINVSEIIVNGESVVGVGSQVSLSGGRAPYQWEIVGMEIDDNGMVTSVVNCTVYGSRRVGTVKVTDACQKTASTEVRLPGGTWVSQPVVWPPDNSDGNGTCYSYSSHGTQEFCEKTTGGTRNTYYWVNIHITTRAVDHYSCEIQQQSCHWDNKMTTSPCNGSTLAASCTDDPFDFTVSVPSFTYVDIYQCR